MVYFWRSHKLLMKEVVQLQLQYETKLTYFLSKTEYQRQSMKSFLTFLLVSFSIDYGKHILISYIESLYNVETFLCISVFTLKCYDCKDDECQNLGDSNISECGTGDSGCAWDVEYCKFLHENTFCRLIFCFK